MDACHDFNEETLYAMQLMQLGYTYTRAYIVLEMLHVLWITSVDIKHRLCLEWLQPSSTRV